MGSEKLKPQLLTKKSVTWTSQMIDELLLCLYFKKNYYCKRKDFDGEIAQQNAAVRTELAAKCISNGRAYFGFAERERLEIYKGCEASTSEQYIEEKRNKSY